MRLRDSARSTWKREHYEIGKLITRILALTNAILGERLPFSPFGYMHIVGTAS